MSTKPKATAAEKAADRAAQPKPTTLEKTHKIAIKVFKTVSRPKLADTRGALLSDWQ